MPLKVIYTECSCQPWFDVAAQLAERHGWRPVYWTGARSVESEVLSRFPGLAFQDNYEASRGIAHPSYASLPTLAIDEALLTDLAECESTTLRMLDRLDPDNSFSYWQRLRLYHQYVRYWLAVLDKVNPDLVVFPASPHLGYDYVLLCLCVRRSIRTITVRETSITGLMYQQSRHDEEPRDVLDVYQRLLTSGGNDTAVSEPVRAYLDKVRGEYLIGRPYYMHEIAAIEKQQREASQQSGGRGLLSLFTRQSLRSIVRWVYRGVRSPFGSVYNGCRMFKQMLQRGSDLPFSQMKEMVDCILHVYDTIDQPTRFIRSEAPSAYFVRRGESHTDKSFMTGLEYRLYRRLAGQKKSMLAEYYESLVRLPDFSKPYVFVALNHQPETSTCPQGGVFAELLLMVRLLSRCLPEGWELYVKEHPVQLHARFSGESSRDRAYYDEMAALPNVRLVPMSTPSFQMIDHSRAVASVNGTAGWEAVVRGKPTIVFGCAWFRGCEGVFYTTTEQQCRDALARIQNGYTVDPEKVNLFIRAIELAGGRGCTLPEALPYTKMTHEMNVQGFVDLLVGATTTRHAA